MEEFEIGDLVKALAPDEDLDWHDSEVFNAGWDEDMESYIGELAKIVKLGSPERRGRPTYYLVFDDGAAWYWDPHWMERKTERKESEISIEDFDSILN